MKLILGTVQFGTTYGAFNVSGQVPQTEASRMLELATQAGVAMLDTARAYGNSEEVLRRFNAASKFDIVSKAPHLRAEASAVRELNSAFDATLEALGVQCIYGYLMHNANDLLIDGVWETLCEMRSSGRVKRIGVSGYDISSVAELCDRYPLTLVQLPANVLDPWYASCSLPERVEVHVRSAFLQGFLLSDPAKLPPYLAPWRGALEQFRFEAARQGVTLLQAALGPLLSCPNISRIVVGADSSGQLTAILRAVEALEDCPDLKFGPFAGVTDALTDPRQWRTAS